MSFQLFNPLTPESYKSRLPVAFDNSLDLYEQVTAVIEHLNLMIENANNVTKEIILLRNQFELFKNMIETKVLPENLKIILEKWVEDGTLAKIINENVFSNINDKIDRLHNVLLDMLGNALTATPRPFLTLSNLVETYPNGNLNTYVVQEDGYLYYYDGSWKQLIKYQAGSYADDSLTSKMRSTIGTFSVIQSTQQFNLNTVTKKLEFPLTGVISIIHKTGSIDLTNLLSNELDVSFNGEVGGWILLDTVTNTFKTVYGGSAERIREDDVLIGTIRWATKPKVSLNLNYTIDQFEDTFDVSSANMSKNFAFPWITSAEPITILPATKKILFPNNSQIRFMNGLTTVNLATKYRNVEVDIGWGGEEQGWLFYNTKTNELKSVYSGSETVVDNYDIPLLSVWWNTFKIDCSFNYTFNGYDSSKRLNYTNKRYLAVGDSLTDGATDGSDNASVKSYSDFVNEFLGFSTYTKDAIRGTTLAIRTGRTDSACERVQNWSGVHYLSFLFGLNDFTRGVPLGEKNSVDKTTFYGALNYVLPLMLLNNSASKILILTPPKNNKETSNPSHIPNSVGLIQDDYNNAILERCAYYSLTVLDLYNNDGMSPYISTIVARYRPDKAHYNESGYKRLAEMVASKMESI